MTPEEQAKAYHGFFFRSQAGQGFMEWLSTMEQNHLTAAQETYDTHELAASKPYKEIRDHIDSLIAQAADQPEG